MDGHIECDETLPTACQECASAPIATLIRVDHIAIAVESLADAIDWYVRALGFELIERRVTRGGRTSMISAVVSAGPITLVLLEGREEDSQVSRFIQKFGPGVQHIAFQVSDLDQAMASVIAAGATADTHIISDAGIRQVFLRRDAGSGVRVELIERQGGNFTDNTVEELFKSFEANDLY